MSVIRIKWRKCNQGRKKEKSKEEKNKLIETNPGLTQKLQYAEKDFKTVIMTKWHIFEK